MGGVCTLGGNSYRNGRFDGLCGFDLPRSGDKEAGLTAQNPWRYNFSVAEGFGRANPGSNWEISA